MKRTRTWNEAKYHKYLAEGRGQGELKEYVPWVQIQRNVMTATTEDDIKKLFDGSMIQATL